jgi:DNA-binding beta-propeller fold protein YncE
MFLNRRSYHVEGKFMSKIGLVFAFAFSTAVASSLYGQSQPTDMPGGEYAVEKSIKIGGPGRWDYLTVGPGSLLYVTRSTHEQVIDPVAGKVVADIDGGQRLHGTAVAPSSNRAFVTDGEAGKLMVIDLKTNTLLGKIDAADDADGTIYDPGTDRVLVTCGDAGQLIVLDPHADIATAKVQKIDLGGNPEFLAADGKGLAYVCLNDKNQIAQVDLKAMKVLATWPCGSGTSPTGLAIDAAGGSLFVGCRNQKMIVMSTTDGKVQAELPIGHGNDACGFDPGTRLAFASCGDGTLTIVQRTGTDGFAIKQTVKTHQGARTMTIDRSTHTVYLPTADFAPAEQGKRPAALPDTFAIVVVSMGAH